MLECLGKKAEKKILNKIENRPGLSHIEFRIGTFTSIKDYLFNALNNSQELSDWKYRGSDDPGIALIEGTSIICDILTFYQNLYANEAYIRTAKWRESVKKLVKLSGYQLSPGLGGESLFAIEVKGEDTVVIPSKFPLKAQLKEIEDIIYFETIKETLAYPEYSNLQIYQPLTIPKLIEDPKNFYIVKPLKADLKSGDSLLVFSGDTGESLRTRSLLDATLVKVEEINDLHGHVSFTIKGSLTNFIINNRKVYAYKVGRNFRAFGHDASRKVIDPANPTELEYDKTILNEQDFFRPNNYIYALSPSISKNEFPVAGDIDDIMSGMDVIVQYMVNNNLLSTIKEIKSCKKFTYTFGRHSGSSTVLDLDPSTLLGGYNTRLSRQSVRVIQGIGDEYRNKLGFIGIRNVEDLAICDAGEISNKLRIPLHILLEFQKEAQIIRELTFEAVIIQSLEGQGLTIQDAIELSINRFMEITGLDFIASNDFLSKLRILAVVMDAEQCRRLGVNTLDTMPSDIETEITDTDIRYMLFHEVDGPLLEIYPYRLMFDKGILSNFLFFGNETTFRMLNGRQLVFSHQDQENIFASVNSVNPSYLFPRSPSCTLNIDKNIVIDNELNYNDPITFNEEKYNVYGNLISANQGKTEIETVLGSGDNREKFQTFKIPKTPLTFHLLFDNSPPETPEIEIFVNDILWERTNSFFGRLPDDEIYIVRQDDKGDSWVQFGDGVFGARLPSGVDNVKAIFRIGTGAYGEIKEGTTVSTGKKLAQLDKVHMITPASGGANEETGLHAAMTAPFKFQSLDRLVSIKDYEIEALSIPGVVKAKASWNIGSNNIPIINITLLVEGARSNEFAKIEEKMMNYDKYHGPQRYNITILQGRFKYIYLNLSFKKDVRLREDVVKNLIEAALGAYSNESGYITEPNGLFSIYNRDFGVPEYWTRIEGIAQNVPGVSWVKINRLGYFDPIIQDPTKVSKDDVIQVNPTDSVKKISCNSKEILRLYFSHLELNCIEVIE